MQFVLKTRTERKRRKNKENEHSAIIMLNNKRLFEDFLDTEQENII